MKKRKIIISILLIMIFAISMNISEIDTYAASKKYTKTYNLKRNYKKTVKLKSKIKSIKSSNEKNVTVTKSGKKFTIRTKKKGTAIITVKCNNKKTYKYKVKVSNKKHIHEYEMVIINTVQETREVHVYFPYICGCNIGWLTYEELDAHQESTGKDGTCNDCGTYIAQVLEVTPNGDGSYYWEVLPCPTCGGRNIERNVKCTGWANGNLRTPITGTSEYSILQCSCGEILTENDKPGDRSFPTDGGYIYISFFPDDASRAKYDIADNGFYSINY